jgi:hypothetical protein
MNSATCSHYFPTLAKLIRRLFRVPFNSAQRLPFLIRRNDVFCNGNSRDLLIDIRPIVPQDHGYATHSSLADRITITVPRGTNTYQLQVYTANGPVAIPANASADIRGHSVLMVGGVHVADIAPFLDAARILSDTLYVGPFRNALNVGERQSYFDIQVGQSFIKAWGSYKSGAVKQQNKAAYAVEGDIKRIFGFRDFQINPSPDDLTLQILVDGQSYNLMEMGAGLTQFVLVLANAAISRRRYVLIDEPELNLHPSLQLDFMTTLGSYASEGVLFATHSVGLARSAGDWRYAVRRSGPDSEVSDLDTTPRLSEFLADLGFSGYRELGFGRVLLVEGKTDVKTIQQFLRKYSKDHTTVPLPLGGSTLINASSEAELSEITRMCDRVFALIDSEKPSADAALEPGREMFRQNCERLGIKCHVMERRAIENYFPQSALENPGGGRWKALAPYQAVDASSGWSKSDNWRIAREMTQEDLDATDIGQFLRGL